MTPNKIKDERIQKRHNQICAPLFPIMLIVTSISLITKIILNIHPLLYTLEIIAIIASITYYTTSTAYNKVLLVKGKDEAITSIKNSAKTHSYQIYTCIILFGFIILSIAATIHYPFSSKQLPYIIPYIGMFIIPTMFVSSKTNKEGLGVTWRNEKEKTGVLKGLRLAGIVNLMFSIIFEVVTFLLVGIGWVSSDLLPTLFASMIFPFILGVSCIVRGNKVLLTMEKNADKEVELAENSVEDVDICEE